MMTLLPTGFLQYDGVRDSDERPPRVLEELLSGSYLAVLSSFPPDGKSLSDIAHEQPSWVYYTFPDYGVVGLISESRVFPRSRFESILKDVSTSAQSFAVGDDVVLHDAFSLRARVPFSLYAEGVVFDRLVSAFVDGSLSSVKWVPFKYVVRRLWRKGREYVARVRDDYLRSFGVGISEELLVKVSREIYRDPRYGGNSVLAARIFLGVRFRGSAFGRLLQIKGMVPRALGSAPSFISDLEEYLSRRVFKGIYRRSKGGYVSLRGERPVVGYSMDYSGDYIFATAYSPSGASVQRVLCRALVESGRFGDDLQPFVPLLSMTFGPYTLGRFKPMYHYYFPGLFGVFGFPVARMYYSERFVVYERLQEDDPRYDAACLNYWVWRLLFPFHDDWWFVKEDPCPVPGVLCDLFPEVKWHGGEQEA